MSIVGTRPPLISETNLYEPRHKVNRLENHQLPATTHYAVLPDPEGKRVGSGGATFNVMRYIAEQATEDDKENIFKNKRILVIHSGGDSKRVPQYSAIGKLFSPVPRELPDGRGSTLFDEFMIGMSGVPSRIKEGMLVLSGDVLLLFNPLQIDAMFHLICGTMKKIICGSQIYIRYAKQKKKQ